MCWIIPLFTASCLLAIIGTANAQQYLSIGTSEKNGMPFYNRPLPCEYNFARVMYANIYYPKYPTYEDKAQMDCCFQADKRNQCCLSVVRNAAGIIEEKCKCLPTVECDCPSGWVPYKTDTTTTCFRLITDVKTFALADNACVTMQGTLANIKNVEINNFITTELIPPTTTPAVTAWIGLHRPAGDGEGFAFADESPLGGYNNWQAAPPEDGTEMCASISSATGQWTAGPCDPTMAYICQK